MKRTFSRLSSVECGAYYHFCSTPIIYADSRKAVAAQQKLIDPHSGDIIRNAASVLSIDKAEPLLTSLHELDHLRSFYTSLFGLAMWRMSLLVNIILTSAFRRRNEIEGWWDDLEPFLPLNKWVLTKGNEIKQVKGGLNQRAFLDRLQWAADIEQFQNALTDRLEMTVGDFLDLANRVSALLALQAGRVSPHWTSERPPHEPYLGGTDFTCRQILEASAILQEVLVVRTAGYDETAVDQIFSSLDRDAYTRCMAETLDTVEDFQLASVAFDEAVNGDLDIIGEQERVLERDHPAWRFKRIVEGMRGMGPLRRPINNDDLEDACRRANLPSSNTMVKSVLAECNDIDSILGKPNKAVSSKMRKSGQIISINTSFIQRRALNEILGCLRKRSVDPFRKIQPTPLLVLYQDDVSPTALTDFGGNLSREQFKIAIGDIVFNLAAWSLFSNSDGDTSRIMEVQKSCQRFYGRSDLDFLIKARKADQEGDFSGFMPYMAMVPKEMLEAMLPSKLYALLHWK